MKKRYLFLPFFILVFFLTVARIVHSQEEPSPEKGVSRKVYNRILRCKMCHMKQYGRLEKFYPRKRFMCLECHGWAEGHPVTEKKEKLEKWTIIKRPTYNTCLSKCHDDHRKNFNEIPEEEGIEIFEKYRKNEMLEKGGEK